MSWLPDKYHALHNVFRKGDVDPDVREEMAHHLEARIEANLAAGMSPEQAETDARRRFGDLARYRRETGAEERSTQRVTARRERFTVARHETRRAWRALLRSPSFSVAAVLTLGVGIGAAVAIFTVLDAVVLRPLPYPDADRLVRIYHPVPKVGPDLRWNISTAEYEYFSRESRTLAAVGLYGNRRHTVAVGHDQAVRVNAGAVTSTALAIFGATARLGRLFVEEDNHIPAAPVVLLSESFWRNRYGGSPEIVGATLRIEGADARIIGVVAGSLALPDWPVDIWVPLLYRPNGPAFNNHTSWAVARLADGVTVEAASLELAGMASTYSERFPGAYSPRFFETTGFKTVVVPWKEATVGDAPRTLWILFASSGLVLLLAAVNVGNLFLVRSQTVRREVAVRSLLGANRAQLAWHHFAEAALIAVAGFAAGIGLAWVGLELFLQIIPMGVGRSGVTIPRLAEVALDWRGVGVAAAVALAAGIGFGAMPLWTDPSAGEAARAAHGMTPSRRENATRNGLVVAQIAVAVVLLAAAGLLMRSFRELRAVEPGFEPEGVLIADVALPLSRYNTYERTTGFYRRLTERLEELPQVAVASVGTQIPVEAEDGCSVFGYPDRPPDVNTSCIPNAVVGPGYFTALGIGLAGRDLAWHDLDARTGAAALSDALARRIFPDGGALDRAVNGPNPPTAPPFRVTGVTQGLRWQGLDRPPAEVAYFPLEPIPGASLWMPPARIYLVVKVVRGDPLAIMPDVRRIVAELDADAAVEQPRTMEQVVLGSLRRVSILMTLLGLSAAAALFLSLIGLYGVVAYTVTRRTREIGVRIAIGAPASAVRRQVVRQSLVLTFAGLGLGLLGALAMGRLLAGLLFGVGATDPVTLIAVAVVLLAVAVVASLRPAARAAAIDPVAALRAE